MYKLFYMFEYSVGVVLITTILLNDSTRETAKQITSKRSHGRHTRRLTQPLMPSHSSTMSIQTKKLSLIDPTEAKVEG